MKLTKTAVEKTAIPAKGQSFYWDDVLPGFGLRVTPSGRRTYIVQARIHGQTRRATIGQHGVFTVDQARKQARAELGRMADGVDPVVEKKKARAQIKRDKVLSVTLREVMASYFIDRRKLKPRSRDDIQRHVDVNFKGWADQPAASITRRMVSERFRKISDRSPAQANQAFRNLRALLNYARAQYRTPDGLPILLENPVDVLSQAKMWNESKAKRNATPLDRMGEWWSTVQRYRIDPSLTEAGRTAADLFAFLAVTGLRSGEARA